MTSTAIAHSVCIIPADAERGITYPVPYIRASNDGMSLMGRSAAASIILHLALVVGVIAVNAWKPSGISGTPQTEVVNVSIIPLSALDTVLPKGTNQENLREPEESPRTQQETPHKQIPKKLVAMKSPSSDKTRPSQSPTAASSANLNSKQTTSETQVIGVPHGQAVAADQARISYQDMVATLLARSKRYPERALKRHMTGQGTIRIEISADGSLSGFEIIRSTDTSILDDELRAMVERASPFPAFPPDLTKKSLALVVPIVFRLES